LRPYGLGSEQIVVNRLLSFELNEIVKLAHNEWTQKNHL